MPKKSIEEIRKNFDMQIWRHRIGGNGNKTSFRNPCNMAQEFKCKQITYFLISQKKNFNLKAYIKAKRNIFLKIKSFQKKQLVFERI